MRHHPEEAIMTTLSMAGRLAHVAVKPVESAIPFLSSLLPTRRRDAEGFTARERADALERFNRAYATMPSRAEVTRSKEAARKRAVSSHGVSC